MPRTTYLFFKINIKWNGEQKRGHKAAYDRLWNQSVRNQSIQESDKYYRFYSESNPPVQKGIYGDGRGFKLRHEISLLSDGLSIEFPYLQYVEPEKSFV